MGLKRIWIFVFSDPQLRLILRIVAVTWFVGVQVGTSAFLSAFVSVS